MPSPIETLIDAATGANRPPAPVVLTPEQKEMCAQLGRDVVSDLLHYYPNALATVPKTARIHLRNTVSLKAEATLRLAMQAAK